MPGAGFAVTKGARKATRIGGKLSAEDKARVNRRNRRSATQELHTKGEEAIIETKLYTDWDVI